MGEDNQAVLDILPNTMATLSMNNWKYKSPSGALNDMVTISITIGDETFSAITDLDMFTTTVSALAKP